jgi:hypothetical protein
MKQLILSLLVILFLGACATHYYYNPAATQPGQTEAVYTRGLPGLRSQQFGADMTAGLSAKNENDLSLQVYIYNDSDDAYTFQPDAIRVSGYDAFGQMQPLRVFEASEYVKWKRNRDIMIGAAVVIATVALILIIHETTKDNNKSKGNNNNSDSGWANNYYYNPIGWIDFSVNTAFVVGAATSPPPQSNPAIPEDGLLRTHTIYPGEAVQGIVKVRGKSPFLNRVLVEVPVNGAYHKFSFENKQKVR